MPCFLIWFQKYSIKKVYLILKIILIGKHFKGNVEALHQSILWISVLYTLSEINGKAAVLAQNVTRKVYVEEMQRMYTCGNFFMDKKTGQLINWELQNRALSLVTWPQYASVNGWQKSNEFMTHPFCFSMYFSVCLA